jgi:isopentenyl diphosphate isomerase/L-lactate dehydrogenase-like FMN-dependent dehydrogenase
MNAPAPDAPPFAVLDDAVIEARRVLPPGVFAYVEGGAEDEHTLVENRRAFSRWHLRPRMLTGAPPADPSTTFLGMPLAMPILVAPFAGDTLLHADGYRAVLDAAAGHGTLAVVPEVTGKDTLEALAGARPAAARVFQVSMRHPEAVLIELLRRAADAGYSAFCVTIDVPVVGVRRRELRHPGATIQISNFEPGAIAHAFIDDTGGREEPWTWARLADVVPAADVPFMVKGVLTAEDARAAVDAGAAAVYVSNHGGRQLDGAPATLDQLAEVVDEVGGDAEIAVDGGVRSGGDVVKALALGADAVLVGRPICYGLAAAGAAGVHRVLELLRHELVTAMTLLGRARIEHLDRTVLQPARR